MLNLQKLLQRIKKLGMNCLSVRFNEKERRVLGIGVAAAVAVSFIALPFTNGNVVHVQAAAVSGINEILEDITAIQSVGMDIETMTENLGEAIQADYSNDLNISRLKLAAGLAGEFEKAEDEDGTLTLFGETDEWTDEMVEEELERIKDMSTIEEQTEPEREKPVHEEQELTENTESEEQELTEHTSAEEEPIAVMTAETAFYASVDQTDIPTELALSYNEQYCMTLSAEQLKVLETIVEAEAGDEDAYGKILVANVVLNRVLSDEFPDTIKEVVFQNNGKTYQFSPVRSGGRYYTVTVSDHTRAAVARALNGEDYSQGALYFFARRYTSATKAKWFDTALRKITEYGCHEFFGNK